MLVGGLHLRMWCNIWDRDGSGIWIDFGDVREDRSEVLQI